MSSLFEQFYEDFNGVVGTSGKLNVCADRRYFLSELPSNESFDISTRRPELCATVHIHTLLPTKTKVTKFYRSS